jgi:hypothetical protein
MILGGLAASISGRHSTPERHEIPGQSNCSLITFEEGYAQGEENLPQL